MMSRNLYTLWSLLALIHHRMFLCNTYDFTLKRLYQNPDMTVQPSTETNRQDSNQSYERIFTSSAEKDNQKLLQLQTTQPEQKQVFGGHKAGSMLTVFGREMTTSFKDIIIGQQSLDRQTQASEVISTTSIIPTLLKEDICSDFGTCEIAHSQNDWYCYCDSDCLQFNDCCPDYFKGKTETKREDNRYHCYGYTNTKDEWELQKGFLAIDTCPETYDNSDVADKCRENNISNHGSFVIHNNSVTFKNKFCAYCHNITDFEYFIVMFYELVIINLAESDILNDIQKLNNHKEKIDLLLQKAKWRVLPPSKAKMRTCIRDIRANEEDFCKLYSNPIAHSNLVYRNFFCVPSHLRQKLRYRSCMGKLYDRIKVFTFEGLSVLFSFKEETKEQQENDVQCQSWTKEIEEKRMCTSLETYENHTTVLQLYMVSDKNMTLYQFIRFSYLVAWSFEVSNLTLVEMVGDSPQLTEEVMFIAGAIIPVTITKRCFVHELKRLENFISQRKTRFVIHDKEVNTTSEVFASQNLPFKGDNSSVQFAVKYPLRRFGMSIAKLIASNFGNLRIELSHVTIDEICNDVTVELVLANDIYYVERVACLQHITKSVNGITISTIVTYITFLVSIVSLLVLIVVNRKFGLVSNTPSHNLENLSFSLITSNVLFMVGIGWSGIYTLCFAIGIALHYIWLLVFSFMTTSVLNITVSLQKLKYRHIESNKGICMRLLLSLISFLCPCIFVIPAVIIELFGPTFLRPNYGERVCFPHQYPANLIFFAGPVFLSITINLISLVTGISQICRLRIEIGHIRKMDPYQDAKLYIRLVVISGIFWVSSVFASISESAWVEFIFILLCGSQGFFIAVANLTTSRARKAFRESNNVHISNSASA